MRTPLNVYFTAFKSIFLSLCTYYLGWMSCMISLERCQVQLRGRRNKWTIQNNLVQRKIQTTNTAPLVLACPSNHSATGRVDDIWLELLQYLFTLRYYKNSVSCAKGYTENENKIIANLQFGDWYHLNMRWLT